MKQLFLLLISIAVFATSCSKKKTDDATTTAEETKTLPYLRLTSLSGDAQFAHQLKGKTILIFFSPDCDHCQREAADIRAHNDSFKGYEIYFIGVEGHQPLVPDFIKTYDLESQTNMHFVFADVAEISREMGAIRIPCINVYSEKGERIKQFNGETPAEEIIKVL